MCDDVMRAGGGGGQGGRAGILDGRDDGRAVQAGLLRTPAVPGEFYHPFSELSTSSTWGINFIH